MNILYTFLFSSVLLFFTQYSYSQTYDFTGVSLTDLNGVTYDLGQYQDDGYTIVLDFWKTNCSSCLYSIDELEELWMDHGPLGDQTYMIFSIEISSFLTNELEIIEEYNITNPVFRLEDNVDLLDDFAFTGTTAYFVTVCPNGSWIDKTGSISEPSDVMASCSASSSITNDAALVVRNRKNLIAIEKTEALCPNENSVTVDLRNIGTNILTSAVIELKQEGNVVNTINWSGSLNKFETEEVTLTGLVLALGSVTNVEAGIVSAGSGNQNVDNDVVEIEVTNIIPSTNDFNPILEMDLHSFADDIFWNFYNSSGALLDNEPDWTYPLNSNETVFESLPVGTDDCYVMEILSRDGRGMSGNDYRIVDTDGNIIVEETYEYGYYSAVSKFIVSADSDNDGLNNVWESAYGTDENNTDTDNDGISDGDEVANGTNPLIVNDNVGIQDKTNYIIYTVYPNPAINSFTVELADFNKPFGIEIQNMLGQVCYSEDKELPKFLIPTENWTNGVYTISISDRNGLLLGNKKIVIDK